MKCGLFLICVIILIKNSDELNCKRDRSVLVDPELKLKLALFCDYESGVLPERNISVNLDLTPVHFWFSNNWDDTRIKIECNLTYTDKNLKWSPADYNNIEAITVDGVNDIKLWMPKISFDEALNKDNALDKCAILGCSIKSNGDVYCAFICKIAVWCETNFRRWPFDNQYCTIHFVSRYNEGEINLTSTPFDMRTFKYVDSPYWNVLILETNYFDKDENQYPSEWNVTVIKNLNFRVARHSSQDVNTIFAPLLIFTVINILVFTADLRSSTRILLLILSILSHLCYLPFLSWIIPKYKDRIPHVALYFIDSMALSMILLIETAIMRKIGKSNNGPIPGYVRKVFSVVDDNFFGWLFLLEAEFTDIRADFPVLRAVKLEHSSPENLKWWQFLKIIDTFFFLVVLIFYLFGLFMEARYMIL